MSTSRPQILALGNAIVDILAHVDDAFLEKHQLIKSTMQLCSSEKQSILLADLKDYITMAGGSCANTISSLASMGIDTSFIGTIGDDKWGKEFELSLKNSGVKTILNIESQNTTGTSVIVITPDSERTMNTHLGVSGKISDTALKTETTSDVQMIILEGYAYDSLEMKFAVDTIVEQSLDSQKIIFTLSDTECVKRHRAGFLKLIDSVDILIGNEQEFCTLFEIEDTLDDNILKTQLPLSPAITIITRSKYGSILITPEEIIRQQSYIPHRLVDVTGAGDQFAAGFIYGIINGQDHNRSLAFATLLATEVISQVGPRLTQTHLSKLVQRFWHNSNIN